MISSASGYSFQSTHPVRDATAHSLPTMTLQKFQSTHPVRDATKQALLRASLNINFNPRIPCGMRLRFLFKPGAQTPLY
jgi:hypothetical protein